MAHNFERHAGVLHSWLLLLNNEHKDTVHLIWQFYFYVGYRESMTILAGLHTQTFHLIFYVYLNAVSLEHSWDEFWAGWQTFSVQETGISQLWANKARTECCCWGEDGMVLSLWFIILPLSSLPSSETCLDVAQISLFIGMWKDSFGQQALYGITHTACLCQPWTPAAAFCPASSTNPAWNPLHPALQGWASPGWSSCRDLVACKLGIHKHGWRHLGHPLWMTCGAILGLRVCREWSNKVQGCFLRSRGGGLEMPGLSLKGSGLHELWLTFIYAVASYPLWWNHKIRGVLWKAGNYLVLQIHNCMILCLYLTCLQF